MALNSFRRAATGNGIGSCFQSLLISQIFFMKRTACCRGSFSSLTRCCHHPNQLTKVVGCRQIYFGTYSTASMASDLRQQTTSNTEDPLDPFSLVADELTIVANRIRSMVLAEVPKLASAAEYFFRKGVEGKRFRPTILLLMASALHMPIPGSDAEGVSNILSKELRAKHQCIAEAAEMIHVASLLHDDVLDDADTRRGINSLNVFMGNTVTSS